eukprot:411998-Amphidinium_carterae.1
MEYVVLGRLFILSSLALTGEAFGRTLNMEAMQAAGVVLGVFPVHYKHVLDDLKCPPPSMCIGVTTAHSGGYPYS